MHSISHAVSEVASCISAILPFYTFLSMFTKLTHPYLSMLPHWASLLRFPWANRRQIKSIQFLEESTCLTSDYTTKPQSSKQYGIGTKTDIQINGSEQKAQRQIHEPMVTLSLTKEARIYNGKKINSLTSGVGKIGQPLVKE